jgi:hypothetical protein
LEQGADQPHGGQEDAGRRSRLSPRFVHTISQTHETRGSGLRYLLLALKVI